MTAAPTRVPRDSAPRSRALAARRLRPPRSPDVGARGHRERLHATQAPRQGHAAAQGRAAPGEPLLLRHHAQAGPGRPQGRRRPGLVRAPAAAEDDQRQARRQARALVAQPAPLAGRPVGPPDRAGRGRLGGDGRLRPLGADAPDDLQAPAARGDDRVLGEPPARRRGRRPQFTHRVDYGETIRRHALGRFDEMLLATAVHPAMLIYLDAASRPRTTPTRTWAASCSSCTRLARATTRRRTSATPPGS